MRANRQKSGFKGLIFKHFLGEKYFACMFPTRDILCPQLKQTLHVVDMSVPNLAQKVGTHGGFCVDKSSASN
jgi:hypothetical protein